MLVRKLSASVLSSVLWAPSVVAATFTTWQECYDSVKQERQSWSFEYSQAGRCWSQNRCGTLGLGQTTQGVATPAALRAT